MRYLRNGFLLSALFLAAGLGMLLYTLHYPPQGVILTLLCAIISIAFFLMVPRGTWIARQLRYRDFIAKSKPFESAEAAWQAFLKQDGLPGENDPLFRKWQALIDAREQTDSTKSQTDQKM